MNDLEPTTARSLRALLATYSQHAFHVGALGAGAAMKLTNNVMLHMNHLIALEALRFARSQGIREQDALEVVGVSTGRGVRSCRTPSITPVC